MEKQEITTREKEKESWLDSDVYLEKLEEFGTERHVEAYKKVLEFSQAIQDRGGRALIIGGCVRDMLLERVSKDFDIEVYGLEPEVVEEIAEEYGDISHAGKAFEVIKMFVEGGICLDISLPREDSKIAEGHKGFKARIDPNMSIEEAAKRRDFTVNSMGFDPLTNEHFDPYGGTEDLKNRTLKVTDPTKFGEDPVRVLRAFQFAARFEMDIDDDAKRIIREVMPSMNELSGERLGTEWGKLLLKSEKPSVGLRQAMELGLFNEIHPEFADLPKTQQGEQWHPEGDAWEHTLQVVDAAAQVIRREGFDLDTESKNSNLALGIIMAALCHDLGKPEKTQFKKDGKITSYGHELAGVKPAKSFLSKIRLDYKTRDRVMRLVKEHMRPLLLHKDEVEKGQTIKDKTIRKLAQNLVPSNIRELTLVSEAGHRGRSATGVPNMEMDFLQGEWLMKKATALGVEGGPGPHSVKGQDFINLGYEQGPKIGRLIELSNDLRDDKHISKEQILEELQGIEAADDAIKKLRQLLSNK